MNTSAELYAAAESARRELVAACRRGAFHARAAALDGLLPITDDRTAFAAAYLAFGTCALVGAKAPEREAAVALRAIALETAGAREGGFLTFRLGRDALQSTAGTSSQP
jgi:hypothetical protein